MTTTTATTARITATTTATTATTAAATTAAAAMPSMIAAGTAAGPIFGWDVGGAHVKVALIEAIEAAGAAGAAGAAEGARVTAAVDAVEVSGSTGAGGAAGITGLAGAVCGAGAGAEAEARPEAGASHLMSRSRWRVAGVAQWACPLWQGIEHLERVIDDVIGRWPAAAAPGAIHAVTMTGEMVDLFSDREAGVRALTAALAARLGSGLESGNESGLGSGLGSSCRSGLEIVPEPGLEAGLGISPGISPGIGVRFFAGAAGWLAPHECAPHWRSIASANWLASANWVARCLPDALFVDIGSTTTDIIPIVGAHAAAQGHDDATRLATGELVYQGVIRTPLCSIAQRVPFDGHSSNVMNEWFATTADIYRLTGELWEPHDQQASADQGPKTVAASRVRLARMIGRDARDGGDEAWLHLAWHWRGAQLRRIESSLAHVVATQARIWAGTAPADAASSRPPAAVTEPGHGALSATAPLVGAGCGRFLARELARRCGRPYVDFGSLVGVSPDCADWSATCAPSVAVGLLLAAACDAASNEARAPRHGGAIGGAGTTAAEGFAQDPPRAFTGQDRIDKKN